MFMIMLADKPIVFGSSTLSAVPREETWCNIIPEGCKHHFYLRPREISVLFALFLVFLLYHVFHPTASPLRPPILSELNFPLQPDVITWDEHSLIIRGERIMIYSGEFHPFRLPVPSLWLDVLQKIKALGFSAVSFYTDW